MRWTKLGEYPVEQHNSPNRGGSMSAHRGVVCHVAEGTFRGTISWQMNPDQRYKDGTKVTTCSTWIVGKARGEIAQMVDTDQIAWCQRDGSRTWLSIEFAGYNTQALTEWQIEAAALILAAVHERYGVPLQVAPTTATGGLGHHSMDRENQGEEWGHEDCPGPKIIAQKPQIVARAIEIAGGDDMKEDERNWLRQLYHAVFIGGDRQSCGDAVPAEFQLPGTVGGVKRAGGNSLTEQLRYLRSAVPAIEDLAEAGEGGVISDEDLARLADSLVTRLGPDVASRLGAQLTLGFVPATPAGQG